VPPRRRRPRRSRRRGRWSFARAFRHVLPQPPRVPDDRAAPGGTARTHRAPNPGAQLRHPSHDGAPGGRRGSRFARRPAARNVAGPVWRL